ncbi:unnamed protein product [Chrysoparadoxa australica]
MRLDDNQVEFIEEQLNKSKVISKELKDDLLDHMCCLVEINMKKGLSFEQAYQKAFLQTSPNGFEEIQHETLLLLNYNRIIIMKRLIYFTGFIFAVSLTLGILLKVLHLPGAGIVLGVGTLGLFCIFIPLLLVNKLKEYAGEFFSVRMKWVFGFLSLSILGVSVFMKIMHLPGANILLGVSFVIFGFGFLPFLFFRMYKKSLEQV